MNEIFIVLSPLNYYLMNAIIKYEKYKKITVITTIEYKDLIKNANKIIIVDLPRYQDNIFKKILSLFLINMIKLEEQHNNLFIPTDYNIFIQLIIKKIKFNHIHYYEEGGTLFYKINERSKNKIIEYFKGILKKILRVEQTRGVLTAKKLERAYVFFPNFLKKYNSNLEYIDMKNLLFKDNLDINVEEKFKNFDYIILTQPLTEDKFCQGLKEIEILKKFINNKNSYLIKIHPREKKEKYKELLKEKNIKLLPEKYNKIPYQVLHLSLNPKNIVSFFSSVLFTIDSNNKDFKRIALVKQLKNKNIEKSIEIMKEYLDDFYIY